MIQKQTVSVNFAKGLDQKSDPLQIAPGKFLALENRVFTKGGRLDKRNGFGQWTNAVVAPSVTYAFSQIAGTVTAGRLAATYGNEFVIGDGLNLYSRSSGAQSWVYKGRAELCSVAQQSVYKNQYNNIGADSASNSTLGLNVFAWESWTSDPRQAGTLNGVQISVIDATTQQALFVTQLANTTTRPKCVSAGSDLYVIYYSGTSLFYVPVTQTGVGAAVSLITNIDTTNPNYDLMVVGTTVYLAYNGTSSTVKVASFNSSMGAVATASKSEIGSNGVGVFSDGSNVWVVYNNGSATKGFILDSTLASTVLAPTTIDSSAAAAGVQNVTGVYDGSKGIVFYDKPGLPLIGMYGATVTNASFVQPAVGATVNVTRAIIPTYSTIYIQGGGYYYCEQMVDYTTSTVTLKNLGYAGNAAPGATVANAAQVSPCAGYQNSLITYNTLTAAGTAGTANTFQRSTSIASKAFLVNGVAHVTTSFDSPLQVSNFICALYNVSTGPAAAIVAKLNPSLGGGLAYRSILPSVGLSSSIASLALPTRATEIQRTSSNVGLVSYNLGISAFQVNFVTNELTSQDIGKNLQIGSGVMLDYDGAAVVEQGFHLYPETISATITAGVGNLGPSSGVGTSSSYGWQVIYQWIDNQGQTHRSAPSIAMSLPGLPNSSLITLTIPTLRCTEKKNVTIAVYRTIANGSTYFRVDTVSSSYPLVNDPTVDSVTFADYAPDIQITGNEQLYTAQQIENIGPPATAAMFEYKNRLIAIPSDNPYVWQFSQQVVSGSPVEFNDTFVKNAGTIGGPLVGGAKLDDKAMLFKSESIYYVTGGGPSPNGANDDFGDAQFVTADAGLQDLRSLVIMPSGIMFKSKKGIYLLDRSLQTRYIGAAVEDYNQYSVVSAQLIANKNQVRYSLSNGTMLVYDYFWTDESGVGQWAAFTNQNVVSAVMFQGLQTYVTSSGNVLQETAGTYVDNATAVNTRFKTGWANAAGLQGYERAYCFYFLAQYISPHTLTINVYYDYSTTPSQTTVITPNSSDLEQWRVNFQLQKCEAFQIEVIEDSSSSPGAGFTMSGLDFVIGAKGGYPRLKAGARAP